MVGFTRVVFDPENPGKTQQALQKFLIPTRVIGMYKPRYGPTDELGTLLRAWVIQRARNTNGAGYCREGQVVVRPGLELGRHDPASDALRLCSTLHRMLIINDLPRMAVS